MPHSHYAVHALKKEKSVCCLQADWDRLSRCSAHPNVFTTFDWFQAWNRRFAHARRSERRRPNILEIRQGGTVTGISPLVRITSFRRGLPVHRIAFAARVCDYNDLVLGDNDSGQIEAAVEFLARNRREWDVIDLRDLRDIGDSITRIRKALTHAGLPFRIVPEEEYCPYMPIDGPWSQMLSRRSSSTRRTYRKQQSRLDEMKAEGLRIRIIEDPHLEPGLLEKMAAVEAQKHVGGKPTQPFVGLHAEAFASLFATLGPRGWLLIPVMELGERMLAWHLLFRCGGKLWGYLTAYDYLFSHLSPGAMLVPAIVDYGYSQGFTEYDFLSGEEPYKMRWAKQYRRTFRLFVWKHGRIPRLRAFIHPDLRPPEIQSDCCDFAPSADDSSKIEISETGSSPGENFLCDF